MEEVVPDDIIPHILSNLPVKTLMKFKCVCKQWSNIIDTPYFAHLHSNQAIQEARVLLPSVFSSSSSSHEQQKFLNPCKEDGRFMHVSLDLVSKFFKSKSYYLVGSCNGLLCFKKQSCDYGRTALLLFNPLRQQLLPLPPPSIKPVSGRKFGLGFDSSTTTCKILSVFYKEISTAFDDDDDDERRFSLGAEIFSLGIRSSSSPSSSWRVISNVPQLFPVLESPVFACGALHWVTDSLLTPETSNSSKKIVAFHVGKEEFSLISWPSAIGFHEKYHLVELRGCLCIVHCSEDYTNIWIMKDNKRKEEEWVREYRIHIATPPTSAIFYPPKFFVEVIGQWEDEQILLRYCSTFVAYNPTTDQLSRINIPGPDYDIEVFCHTFTGSLISLSGFQAAEQINPLVEA